MIALRLFAVALLAVSAGCSGGHKTARKAKPAAEVPARSTTAGDDLLAALPAGADLLVEIDLDRLRRNPVVGGVARQLLEAQSAAERFEVASLYGIDLILIASYALGTDRTVSFTIARGDGVRRWKRGHRIDDRTVALAPNGVLDRLRRVASKSDKSLAQDRLFLRMRAASMPDRAPAATFRLTARLGFDARVRLSSMFDLDQVPVSLSVWGDVIDDLAVVAYLGGTSDAHARALAEVARGWRDKLARDPILRRMRLHLMARGIEIEPKGRAVRVVWVIGPKRLERVVKRLKTEAQR